MESDDIGCLAFKFRIIVAMLLSKPMRPQFGLCQHTLYRGFGDSQFFDPVATDQWHFHQWVSSALDVRWRPADLEDYVNPSARPKMRSARNT